MTNVELATSLTGLAAVYQTAEDGTLTQPYVSVCVNTKKELLTVLHGIGGKFAKRMSDYSVTFESVRLPGVSVRIDREKVCKRIVTWDCSPVLSDEDLMEVEKVTA